ncbi:MAG: rhomboid family intramembrane serine protease [Ferruginibacter sp.]
MSLNQYESNSRITPAVLNLVIINAIVFFGQRMFGGVDGPASDYFALHHYRSDYFQWYQLITHMFMHGSLAHLLFNMLALWMFGTVIEKIWGVKRFLIFYFLCGIGAALVQLGSYAYTYRAIDGAVLSLDQVIQYQRILRTQATVGASGAIMGVVAAYGYLFPNTQMMIIPIPVPIKAKWAVMGIIAIDVFSGIAGDPGDNVAHFAHVGGALTGFLIVYFQNRKSSKTFF